MGRYARTLISHNAYYRPTSAHPGTPVFLCRQFGVAEWREILRGLTERGPGRATSLAIERQRRRLVKYDIIRQLGSRRRGIYATAPVRYSPNSTRRSPCVSSFPTSTPGQVKLERHGRRLPPIRLRLHLLPLHPRRGVHRGSPVLLSTTRSRTTFFSLTT